MPARIRIEAEADTAEELRAVLAQAINVAPATPGPSPWELMGEPMTLGDLPIGSQGLVQGGEAEPKPKSRRGRKPKANGHAETGEPMADPEAADPLGLDEHGGDTLTEPLPPPTKDQQSPAEMIKQGSLILKGLVERNPGFQQVVASLRTKFGVEYFKDMAPERAAEFLSDAMTAEAQAQGAGDD